MDAIIDEAHDPESTHPFKGNVDLEKLENLIEKVGPEKVPYVSLAATVNMAGRGSRFPWKTSGPCGSSRPATGSA